MADQSVDQQVVDRARRSPTALTAALERAIATGDRALERSVLEALASLGIVLVDRSKLAETVREQGRR